MMILEMIGKRRAELLQEYSPDSGLSYDEWITEKLIEVESQLADLELIEKAIGEGVSLSVRNEKYIASKRVYLKSKTNDYMEMSATMSANSDISHADAIRNLQTLEKEREALK